MFKGTLLVLLSIGWVQSGSILFYMSMGSNSHWNTWQPLIHKLAERGHNLTVVSPFQDKVLQKAPNVKSVITEIDFTKATNSTAVFSGEKMMNFAKFKDIMIAGQNKVMAMPEIREMVDHKPDFDVAIVFITSIDAVFYALTEIHKIPFAFYFPATRIPAYDFLMGNPVNPSYIPVEFLNYSQEMTFLQRVLNTLVLVGMETFVRFSYWMSISPEVQRHLNLTERPDVWGAGKNAELLFTNSHPIYDGVRPINPNTIFVGGIHCREGKALPKDIQKWMDEAEHGVIYVSFGSILTGSNMPLEKQQQLMNTLGRLKQRVIWKWETEEMTNKPSNILLKNWCPQQDILAHPNAKLFITHGGLLSTQEALFHGVPMIYMPGFADQFANAARAERLGFGKQIDWPDLTEELLYSTIMEVTTNPSFDSTLERMSSLFKDNPIHPLDKAVHSAEFLIRHKGAKHLRPANRHLNWFQFCCLDVALFIGGCLIMILSFVFFMVRCLFRCCCGSRIPSAKLKSQ
ncbi:hypothetical protein TCAL_06710 [Tigriopus californicus]|uniref:UDP-glucuronosyltransferase n=1 Tax=Tigriopus californicus TaxID=6832 RepID=A0A553P8P9_TIGCA|nr:UDP-glycosyltransferase UGT5-like [Tigriopus californicus]TRY74075.1 hypothetical protein TCAL_06710 [Tigriopus californicus]|eukprot:TCALIF_06710-PA protein Name:"Similar to UGT1A10 UDP-glucuronosyltransferase 1-10 (Homo sapiens)" AED:0.04 eAED:0.04 QI:15/1/1/1/1/1/3/18/514